MTEKEIKKKVIYLTYYAFYVVVLISAISPIKDCLSEIFMNYDYPIHFMNTITTSKFLKDTGKIWGYNPYHYGGYIDGIYQGIDTHWTILFQVLFGKVFNPEAIYNVVILVTYILLPVLVILGAKNFKLGKTNSLYLFVYTIFYILFFHPLVIQIRVGMYAYVTAAFLSFFTVSIFYKYLVEESNKNLIAFTVFSTLAFFIHPLSVLICAIYSIGIVLLEYRKLTIQKLVKITVSFCIVILINLIWILPYLKFSHFFYGFGQHWQTSWETLLEIKLRYFPLIITLFYSIYINYKNKEQRILALTVLPAIIAFIVSFFGSQLGLASMEPSRTSTVFYFIMIISISSIAEKVQKRDGLWKHYPVIVGFMLIIAAHPNSAIYCGSMNIYHKRLHDFLVENIDKKSRLQIQMGLDDYPVIFGSHYYSMLSYETGVEVLAGLHPAPPENVRFAQFVEKKVFGKNLADLSHDELEFYYDLYNIKHTVVFGEEEKSYFENSQNFEKVYEGIRTNVFEYKNAANSFCYNCIADISADYNVINVSNADSETLTLKYHYFDFLKTKPESVTISPVYIGEDPIPFIKVETNGSSSFTIFNK